MFRIITGSPMAVLDDDGVKVTVVRDSNPGPAHNVFVAFDDDGRRLWTQRAPGDASDPRGERDTIQHGEQRGALWRASLSPAYRDLLDRAAAANLYAQWTE